MIVGGSRRNHADWLRIPNACACVAGGPGLCLSARAREAAATPLRSRRGAVATNGTAPAQRRRREPERFRSQLLDQPAFASIHTSENAALESELRTDVQARPRNGSRMIEPQVPQWQPRVSSAAPVELRAPVRVAILTTRRHEFGDRTTAPLSRGLAEEAQLARER